jgi:hypothetical protein
MTASCFQAPHQLHLRGLWPVPASLECPSQCDTAPIKLEGPKASPSLPGVRYEGQLPGPTATVNSAGVLGPLVGQSQCQSQPEVAAAAQCDTPPTTLEGPGPMATGSLSPGLRVPGVRCDDQLPGPTAAVRRVRWVRRRLLASLRVSHCHCHWVAAAAQCGPAQGGPGPPFLESQRGPGALKGGPGPGKGPCGLQTQGRWAPVPNRRPGMGGSRAVMGSSIVKTAFRKKGPPCQQGMSMSRPGPA